MFRSLDTRSYWDDLLASGTKAIELDGTWFLLSHDLVESAALNDETFSSDVSRFLQLPNGLDGKKHTKYRKIIDHYMSSEIVASLAPTCEQIANEITNSLPRDTSIEVISSIGVRFAVRAQLAWLGWDQTSEDELVEWVDKHRLASKHPIHEHLVNVSEHFDEIVRKELKARRVNSSYDDLTAKLMKEKVDGKLLKDEQLVSILRNWTAGDLTSMAASIGVVINAISVDSGIQRRLRDLLKSPDQLLANDIFNHAIDELLRIDDPFLSNRRITTRDITIEGNFIPKASRVVLAWTAANRDPQKFDSPNEFCPHANAKDNLVYGAGKHACPGRELSTMQLRVITRALLAATSAITADPEKTPIRSVGNIGGLDAVYVQLA